MEIEPHWLSNPAGIWNTPSQIFSIFAKTSAVERIHAPYASPFLEVRVIRFRLFTGTSEQLSISCCSLVLPAQPAVLRPLVHGYFTSVYWVLHRRFERARNSVTVALLRSATQVVAVGLHGLFLHDIPLLILDLDEDSDRARARGLSASDLIAQLNTTFTNCPLQIHSKQVRSRLDLVRIPRQKRLSSFSSLWSNGAWP